jgi:hypothetical protein
MAFTHGKDSVFKVDNSSGTLTDISSYVNNVDFPETVDIAETTTLGSGSKSYIVGLKDATLSISGLWDSTLDGVLGGIIGQSATVSFEYGPEGSTAGDVKYTGEAILTGYTQTSPVGDVVAFSADLQVSGDVTRGVYS